MRVRCRCLGCTYTRTLPATENKRCAEDATQEDGLCDDCRRSPVAQWLSEVFEVNA